MVSQLGARWNVMTKLRGVNSVCGNARRKEEERGEKWQVNLFLLSYFVDSVGLYFWPPSFSVNFYLTSYFGIIRTMASKQFDVRLIPEFSGAAVDIPIIEWWVNLWALQNNHGRVSPATTVEGCGLRNTLAAVKKTTEWHLGDQTCSYKSLRNRFVCSFQPIYHTPPLFSGDCG